MQSAQTMVAVGAIHESPLLSAMTKEKSNPPDGLFTKP
jgi:hypothetical protein